MSSGLKNAFNSVNHRAIHGATKQNMAQLGDGLPFYRVSKPIRQSTLLLTGSRDREHSVYLYHMTNPDIVSVLNTVYEIASSIILIFIGGY